MRARGAARPDVAERGRDDRGRGDRARRPVRVELARREISTSDIRRRWARTYDSAGSLVARADRPAARENPAFRRLARSAATSLRARNFEALHGGQPPYEGRAGRIAAR